MSLCVFIICSDYLAALLKDVAVLVAAGDQLQSSRGQSHSLLLRNFLELKIMRAFLLNLLSAQGEVFQFLVSSGTTL